MKKIILFLIVLAPLCTLANNETIFVGVYESEPFVIFNENSEPSGIAIELWENTATRLGYEWEYILYSELDIPKLITDVNKGTIDVAVGSLTITSERFKHVNFTEPYFISSLSIAVPKINSDTSYLDIIWTIISNRYIAEYIILLVIVLLIVGLFYWLFDYRKNETLSKNPGIGIFQGSYFMWVTMTTVGYGDVTPRSSGAKIYVMIWMLLSFFLTSTFIGGISSKLTVDSIDSDIKSLQDIRKYRSAAVSNTTSQIFLNSNGINHIGLPNAQSGITSIINNSIDVFVYDTPVLQYMINKDNLDNTIMLLDQVYDVQYYGFATRKGFNIEDDLNPLIIEILEGDEWTKILNEYNLN